MAIHLLVLGRSAALPEAFCLSTALLCASNNYHLLLQVLIWSWSTGGDA